jgi:hypothetical protein
MPAQHTATPRPSPKAPDAAESTYEERKTQRADRAPALADERTSWGGCKQRRGLLFPRLTNSQGCALHFNLGDRGRAWLIRCEPLAPTMKHGAADLSLKIL